MKFSQLLDANMVPEWRHQYLDYKHLDTMLTKAIQSKNNKTKFAPYDLYQELIKFDQKFAKYFISECQKELVKINLFHCGKLEEMKGKCKNLNDQLDAVLLSPLYTEINTIINGSDFESSLVSLSTKIKQKFSILLKCKLKDQELSDEDTFNEYPVHSKYSTLSINEDMFGEQHFMGNNSVSNGFSPSSWALDIKQYLRENCFSSSTDNLNNNKDDDDINNNNHQSPGLVKVKSSSLLENKALSESNSVVSFVTISSGNNNNNNSSNDFNFKDTLNKNKHVSNFLPGAFGKSCSKGNSLKAKGKIINQYKKKLQNLEFAYKELYFSFVLLEQYTLLNYSGFEQILRKYDRMFASTFGRTFFTETVQKSSFYNNLKQIDHLIEQVEHLYTLHFESGNRRKAISKLQVPLNVYKQNSAGLEFRVGLELGMFVVLFLFVLLHGFSSKTLYDWRTVFRLYRSPLLLIIFLFQFGISLIIWKHYKINHVLIFELDPRNNLSYQHFIEFASILGIIWSISVLIFLHSTSLNVKPSICPLVVVLFAGLFLFNPTNTCHPKARFWLIKRFARIFTAPFHRVFFADFWVADQLVSIVPLFLDLEFLSCFYTTDDVFSVSHLSKTHSRRCVTRNIQDLVIRTIVAAFPAWTRSAQCLRRWRDENWHIMHLCNADPLRIVWLVAAIFTSALTTYWDIIYDFGLFNSYDKKSSDVATFEEKNQDQNSINQTKIEDEKSIKELNDKKKKRYPFLRDELVYPPWVYYFAIVENVILRFGWILTISLTEFSDMEAGLVVSLLAPLEMFRRFVWNCIRLENEQLNNCGLFREVRDIPLEVVAPIDESYVEKVMMIMDSKDGASLRDRRLMKRRTLKVELIDASTIPSQNYSTLAHNNLNYTS